MTSIQLTAKQTALMAAIADRQFSFFDDGIVEYSGIWQEVLGQEIAGSTKYPVSATVRGVATVANTLAKKGLLAVEAAEGSIQDSEGAWTYLTAAGVAWCEAYTAAKEEEAPVEEAAAEVVEEAAAEVVEEAAAEVVLDIPGEYVISEWTEDNDDEWIQTVFADGTKTLRRRRKVSGAWRTDFWGVTAEGKRVATTSKAAKAAREAGTFTI